MSTISDLIKRLRDIPLSQSQIARGTGIPQPRISRWQAGKSTAVANDALRIVEFLEKHEKKKARKIKEVA